VPRTIPHHLRAAVDDAPDKVWLVTPDAEFTYAETLQRVERAAAALRALDVRPDDRVIVTARNSADYLLSWFALMDVGAIQVPINPAGTAAERQGFVEQVRPKLVIDDANVGTLFDAEPDGKGPATRAELDVAVMIPTSGTTGRSKLVMQTHLAYVMAGEGFPDWMQLTGDDRLLTSLPLFHINAPAYSVLGSLAARASVVLLPGFSARTFLDDARKFGATEFNSIGAMLEILVRQPPRADDADNPIRRCYTGPSPDREHQLAIEQRFGFEIVCGYALSESPYALIWRHGERPYGSLGSARQHPELGHVNDARVMDNGRLVAAGEVGELELRNPAIMRGYYEMPEETEKVIVDGWLRTGDLVRDNGDETYTFVGRKKDVIRRRGENLSPLEVEAALERHPDVVEAAVIAVPSELSEDDVKAFLTVVPGATVDLRGVRALAAAELARFKVPRYFEVVDELPHTATGRLAKHQLPTGRTATEIDFDNQEA
jgi:crotonobetaine/carnitine-CoA ligase